MEYGKFINHGAQYVVETPKTPNKWFNYLFNDEYYLEVTQTGQGDSRCLVPEIRTCTKGYRYFYIYNRNSKEYWSSAYRPLKTELGSFECIHSLGWTEIKSNYKGIKASIKVFVPREGTQEVWTFKFENGTDEAQELSAFSAFSLEFGDTMGSKCKFNEENGILNSFTFPYHVFYDEKEKLNNKNSLIYMFSDKTINSYECGEKGFFGGDDTTEVPDAVLKGGCSNNFSEGDKPIGVFEHRISLKAGEVKEFNIIIGCANNLEEAKKVKNKFLTNGYIKEELNKVNNYWKKVCSQFSIETPDENLNYLVNYWLKKQVVLMAKNNRLSVYCPVRNQLQDAMGYGMLDNKGAEELIVKVMREQQPNGYIKQWYMTDGSAPKALCLLNHMDAPIWLVSCMCALIQQSGDISILEREVGFKNSTEKASVYEHMLRAIYFLSEQTGKHGLCLMGDGDWTDPINGAGRLGKGESTWSSMGLKYAILQLLPLVQNKKDTINESILKDIAQSLDEAINAACWDGNWYVTGYDDFGRPFGKSSDEEGKIFLNAQTWAIMSETAREDRLKKCVESIETLNSPCGPLLLEPAFSDWNKTWGRISIKVAGTTENGAIYCHGSMFKAYSDCLLGDGLKAYETIIKTLPTNPENDPQKSSQMPIFVPNYYFGLRESSNFGKSSNHHSTGTAAWLLWVTLEHMLGANATIDGLKIKPCIPAQWKEFTVKRTFKNAVYEIQVKNPEGAVTGVKELYVNGYRFEGELLPYEDGKIYKVQVIMS